MREVKKVNVLGKETEVRELRVKDVREIIRNMKKFEEGVDAEFLFDFLTEIAPKFTKLSVDEVEELTFSDIKKIKDAFMEVNHDFFEILGSLGMEVASLKAQVENTNNLGKSGNPEKVEERIAS